MHLAGLPPDYLRISSGLGEAAPAQAEAWPLASREALLAVIEVASFRALGARERALLEELLPAAALNLQVLQRNLSTQELLVQTRDQAEELEAQQTSLRRTHERSAGNGAVLHAACSSWRRTGSMVTDENGVIKLSEREVRRALRRPAQPWTATPRPAGRDARAGGRALASSEPPRWGLHRSPARAFDGLGPRAHWPHAPMDGRVV